MIDILCSDSPWRHRKIYYICDPFVRNVLWMLCFEKTLLKIATSRYIEDPEICDCTALYIISSMCKTNLLGCQVEIQISQKRHLIPGLTLSQIQSIIVWSSVISHIAARSFLAFHNEFLTRRWFPHRTKHLISVILTQRRCRTWTHGYCVTARGRTTRWGVEYGS